MADKSSDKLDAGLKSLRKFLKKNWGGFPSPKISIEHCDDEGFRIMEITASWKRKGSWGGESIMRTDNPALILLAEDFVLTHHVKPWRPDGWLSDLDVHSDAKDGLLCELES